jgi:hypothetical protein
MKTNLFIFLILLLALPAFAQNGDMSAPSSPEATPEITQEPLIGEAEVQVESAFIRALPSLNSEEVASVFENERLEVVGRNADGLWFLVRRPYRLYNLGWMAVELLDYDFAPEFLPMLDYSTDLLGTSPINPDAMPVVLVAETNLRAEPDLGGEILAVIPLGAILPATGRDTDALWLYVNYRGIEGWINSSVYQRPEHVLDLPDLTFDPNTPQISSPIIPPEIQLSQLEDLRAYAQASHDVAQQLGPFWENVFTGEVMPCEPPPFVQSYLVSHQDVRELPELNRFVPRFNQGITLLNQAIDPLYTCGVLMPDIVLEARNDAINAEIITADTLVRLDQLEDQIRETNRLDPRTSATATATP